MPTFNEQILLVLRWLQNKNTVSADELRDNYRAAEATYAAAEANDVAANAAYATALTAYHAVDDAKHWLIETKERLDEYFELTKEDREAYEKQAKYLNVLSLSI